MKTVSVAQLPSLIEEPDLKGTTAIVIDVLRATSVIPTALASGALRIWTTQSIDEAIGLQRQCAGALLCGERGGLPIEGFDLSNSPAEYTTERVSGRTLIMTTTNGTKALQAVSGAEHVVTASLLNLSAAASHASQSGRVLVVCAGTNGSITGEDVLAAGGIAEALVTNYGFSMQDDQTRMAKRIWDSVVGPGRDTAQFESYLSQTIGGINLKRIGYDDDLQRVAQLDRYPLVPRRVGSNPIELRAQGS